MIAALLAFAAHAADFSGLESDAGWLEIGVTEEADVGPVTVYRKDIGPDVCLRGRVHTDVRADVMLATAADIDTGPSWSPERLAASEVLSRSGDVLEYWQLLDIPGWTLVADRFWVLRGTQSRTDAASIFRWERFDWRAAHPEVVAKLADVSPSAVEPPRNIGFWRFDVEPTGSLVTYAVCADPGGALPAWLQRRVAIATLPSTVGSLVRESRKRAAR